jgi:N-acetylglutamate synthase-like GNAT family acetyltransferase
VGEHLLEDVHSRPAELQPIAETLTNASLKILSAAYVESLQFLAERGFQTVDQATPPGQRQQ